MDNDSLIDGMQKFYAGRGYTISAEIKSNEERELYELVKELICYIKRIDDKLDIIIKEVR